MNQVFVPSSPSAAAKSGPPESPSQVSAFDVPEPAHIWYSALFRFHDSIPLKNLIQLVFKDVHSYFCYCSRTSPVNEINVLADLIVDDVHVYFLKGLSQGSSLACFSPADNDAFLLLEADSYRGKTDGPDKLGESHRSRNANQRDVVTIRRIAEARMRLN